MQSTLPIFFCLFLPSEDEALETYKEEMMTNRKNSQRERIVPSQAQ